MSRHPLPVNALMYRERAPLQVRQSLVALVIDDPNVALGVGADLVPLVEEHKDTASSIFDEGRKSGILVCNLLGGIHHQEDDVTAFDAADGARGSKHFEAVVNLRATPNAGGVDESILLSINVDHRVDCIHCGPRSIVYDVSVIPDQAVDEGRLSDVWATEHRDSNFVLVLVFFFGQRGFWQVCRYR